MIAQPSSAYLTSYYVEDEDNVGSVRLRGTAHSSGTLYKGNGSYIYGRGSAVTVTPVGSQYTRQLYYQSGEDSYTALPSSVVLYTAGSSVTYYKGNGSSGYLRGDSVDAIEYDGTLYEDGGEHKYTLYNKVSKTLYAAGSTKTFPAYKPYSGKVYDAGQTVTFNAAEFEIETVTGLTV